MNQLKKLIFSLIIFQAILFTCHSQKDSYSLNQFELNSYTGGSLVKFKYDGGNHKLKNQIAPLYGFRLQYNRKINRKFQINAALGLGAHAFTYALPETPSYYSTDREHFFNSFQELYVGTRYTIPLKNNFTFGLNLGSGVTYYSGDFVGILKEYESFGNSSFTQTVRMDYLLNFQIIPYVELGPQISRTFKNKNELSLKLSYVQNFRTIYKGQYQIFNNTSFGTFQNSGSNFKLTLGYTFTGDRRLQKIEEINEDLSDIRTAKIEYKKNRRFIHPQSMYVSVLGGIGYAKSFSEDPSNMIQDDFGEALSARIMIEKGLKKNFFLESGYQLFEYNSSFNIRSSNFSFSNNEFLTHQLNIGAGYRVIGNRRNYHYFNLHTGLSVGFIPLRKGQQAGSIYNSSSSIGTVSNSYSLTYSSETEVMSSFIIAPYVGISKDFRITESMFITLLYRYQRGLNNISRSKITFEDSDQYTTPMTANSYLNGTEHTIQVGLKFKLNRE